MVDLTLIFFFKNTLLISLLFWFLTFVGNFFFDRIEYKNREDFYECGFKTTSDLNFNLNFSFFISGLFLILYDIELIFLIPFLFNYELLSWNSVYSYIIFSLIIFFTLVIDVWTETVEWNF